MATEGARRIRVVHLVTTLDIGGLEMVVLDLLRCRDREHIDAHVICLAQPGEMAGRCAEWGVEVETVGRAGEGTTRRILRLARRLRELRPDILHTHNPGPHMHGAIAKKLAGVPVLIHTKHGRNSPGRWLRVAINRTASTVTDYVAAVSDDAARVALDVERVPARKVLVLHNGVDLERFAFREPAAVRDGWRAVTVARLNPVKDQETMLRAIRQVVDAEPTFRFDIVGDGPSRGTLERQAVDLGLGDHVRFHGFQGDIPGYLAAADYFVLSSVSEGISLTLLEAMAVGLPIVATDVGGNREVVVQGETGVLVPPSAPAPLAQAMLGMHESRRRLRDFACAGRERVEQEFSLSRMVSSYENLYRSASRGL